MLLPVLYPDLQPRMLSLPVVVVRGLWLDLVDHTSEKALAVVVVVEAAAGLRDTAAAVGVAMIVARNIAVFAVRPNYSAQGRFFPCPVPESRELLRTFEAKPCPQLTETHLELRLEPA